MKEVKERPIPFNAQMVRAILDGRKTMTRRVVNKLNGHSHISRFSESDTLGYDFCFRDKEMRLHDITKGRALDLCPYGKTGNKLWVRETFAHSNMPDGPLDKDCSIFYRADYFDDPHGLDGEKSPEGKYRNWKPSMFLPRWASRIDLEITNVKIERLQNISEEDAKKEGADALICDNLDQQSFIFCKNLGMPITDKGTPHRNGFALLWDNINAKKGNGWDANPWVWAIKFRLIENT